MTIHILKGPSTTTHSLT